VTIRCSALTLLWFQRKASAFRTSSHPTASIKTGRPQFCFLLIKCSGQVHCLSIDNNTQQCKDTVTQLKPIQYTDLADYSTKYPPAAVLSPLVPARCQSLHQHNPASIVHGFLGNAQRMTCNKNVKMHSSVWQLNR